MPKKDKGYHQKITKAFASRWVFVGLLVFFVFEATWIALSGRYPMAFDEATHLATIQFYANPTNLFTSSQPLHLDQFGPVIQSPSYVYHFLMSFPWRVISYFTNNLMIQVMALRLINVTMFTAGIVLFYRVLLRATKNRVIINLTMFIFILTPIVPLLAGQINYDNLLFPLIAANLLLILQFVDQLKKDQPELELLVWILALGLITSLVKYTFLPIFVAIVLFLAWHLIKAWRADKAKLSKQLKTSYVALTRLRKLLLVLVLLVSIGLFVERYGMNLARYHNPVPTCVQVIGVERCESYSIYRRGIIYAQNKPAEFNTSPIFFSQLWLWHMAFNIFSTINGPESGYSVGLPLFLPHLFAEIFGIGGLALCFLLWRRILRGPAMGIFVVVVGVYCSVLWRLNYADYLDVGRRVAIQGRYLVPLLPMIYLAIVLAFHHVFRRWPKIQTSLAALAIISLLAGGGVLTFILHSDANWYWQNHTVIRTNEHAQNILRPVVPGSKYIPYWDP